MIKKVEQITLIVLLAIMLVTVPVYWISFNHNSSIRSVIEGRRMTVFPQISFADFKSATKQLVHGNFNKASAQFYGRFFNNTFQNKFNSATSDQFPLRINFLQFEKVIERGTIQLAYAMLPDPALPASITSDGRTRLVMRNEPILFYSPSDFNRKGIDARLQNMTVLINRFPQVKFFVFFVDRLIYSKYNPAAPYFPQADNGQSIAYFENNKPPQLIVGKMMIESFQEEQNCFFRTDHHWNIHGAWKAYEGMYQMIAPYYPDIGPKLTPKKFQPIPGVEFCGTFVRLTLYPCQPEPFEYVEVDLPPYKTIINNKEVQRGKQKQYLAGKFSPDMYTNHYGAFFGNDYGLVEYHFQNNSHRNLLFIGSSFKQAMEVYIASHFHNTYTIDLRYLNNYSLGKMIAEYQVTDVLVLGGSPSLSDSLWIINP